MFPGHIHPAMMGLGYMAAASNFPQVAIYEGILGHALFKSVE